MAGLPLVLNEQRELVVVDIGGTGGIGDPTIRYASKSEWAQAMGRGGKFGTPDHTGKMPINYEIDLASFADEY